MRDPYIDKIIEHQKDHLKYFSEFGYKIVSGYFEKAIIWIIGLSTGSILFIFKFFPQNYKENKFTIILLICTIGFGLIGRILYAIAFYLGFGFLNKFYLKLNDLSLPITPKKLEGNESSEFIYLLFMEEFKIDLPIFLKLKENATKEKLELLDQEARKLYENYSDYIIDKNKKNVKSIDDFRKIVFKGGLAIDVNEKGEKCWLSKVFPKKLKIWPSFTWIIFFYISSLYYSLSHQLLISV